MTDLRGKPVFQGMVFDQNVGPQKRDREGCLVGTIVWVGQFGRTLGRWPISLAPTTPHPVPSKRPVPKTEWSEAAGFCLLSG